NTSGEYILYGRVLPSPLGRILWVAIKPTLVVAVLGACWFFYRLVRIWHAGVEPGFCCRCGYDLRATPDPAAACGTIVNPGPAPTTDPESPAPASRRTPA